MPRKVVSLCLKTHTSQWLPGAEEREELRVTANGYVLELER